MKSENTPRKRMSLLCQGERVFMDWYVKLILLSFCGER